LLKKFPCWLIDLSSRYSGVATQAATDKLSLKAQVDGLAADNSLLETKVDGLAAEVTQLKADQAKAQELLDKRQAEAESKEKGLQQRL
jgi:outer membrane murein-binding lipoprotein Lpp